MINVHSITIPDCPDEPLSLRDGFRHCDSRSCIGAYMFDFICSICNEVGAPIPHAYLTTARTASVIGYTIDLYRRDVNCVNAYLYGTIILSKNGKFIQYNPVTAPETKLF